MTTGAESSPLATISLNRSPATSRSPWPSQQIRAGSPWKATFSCAARIQRCSRSLSGNSSSTARSVASPYRETESMLDGSDAIADWPLLNAMLNTSSGATWVSIHHGGGVGIGRSVHAGQVSVADGTELAAQKLERVLTNDPGTGIVRHVDAGYDRAVEVAAERGVRTPMLEG